jgi:membrane protease YdiL (CAAX protease family)
MSLAPVDEQVQSAVAYATAALVVLVLTFHGRRGLPPMTALPGRRATPWLLAGVAAGLASGGLALGHGYLQQLREVHQVHRLPLHELQRELVGAPWASSHGVYTSAAIVFMLVLVAPLVEETFFRGWLQNAIASDLPEAKRWLAPLLSAFAAAAVGPPGSFVSTLVMGLGCGVLYARSGAVGPAFVAHAVHASAVLAVRYFFAADRP